MKQLLSKIKTGVTSVFSAITTTFRNFAEKHSLYFHPLTAIQKVWHVSKTVIVSFVAFILITTFLMYHYKLNPLKMIKTEIQQVVNKPMTPEVQKKVVIDYMFKNSNQNVPRADLEAIYDTTYNDGKDPLWLVYLSMQKAESDWWQYAMSYDANKAPLAKGLAGIHRLWASKLIGENIWTNERDAFSISGNIAAQKKIFKEYLKNENGSLNAALISYCLGPNASREQREATEYHSRVLKTFGELSLVLSSKMLSSDYTTPVPITNIKGVTSIEKLFDELVASL